MRRLSLDPESEADVVGFEGLRVTVGSVDGVSPAAWRVVGGWMVRGWAEGGTVESSSRPTNDVDLALFPGRGRHATSLVPRRLAEAGLRPDEEPFRLRRDDGVLVDLLVPPGGSRGEPPKIGKQILFRADGAAFAFELPPEAVRVRLERRTIEFQIPRLAAALVHKTIVLASMRPRYLVDAADVARLLAVTRREPQEAVEDFGVHRRRSDVRRALEALADLFGDENARGARWVEQEHGTRVAVTSVDDAGWLRSQIGLPPSTQAQRRTDQHLGARRDRLGRMRRTPG